MFDLFILRKVYSFPVINLFDINFIFILFFVFSSKMSTSSVSYRLLEEEDWQQWKEIRLEALRDYPVSFSADYDVERVKDDAHFKSNISDNRIFGAFMDGKLISTVGLQSNPLVKMRHRGLVFGVYTAPSARGLGVTKVLIEMVIEEARRKKMAWVHLVCAFGNDAAFKLYEKVGFRIMTTEPRSMIVGDTYIDQYIMAMNLD